MDDYTPALQGGILVGLASWIMLAGVGRASSVSAMTLGILTTRKHSYPWRWAFLLGLVCGGAFFAWALGVPHMSIRHPLVLIPAGFMVGFGAVLGSGSASGHAIVGLGRRSRRSLAAVLTFAGAAVGTVMLTAHLPTAAWWGSALLDALHRLIGR